MISRDSSSIRHAECRERNRFKETVYSFQTRKKFKHTGVRLCLMQNLFKWWLSVLEIPTFCTKCLFSNPLFHDSRFQAYQALIGKDIWWTNILLFTFLPSIVMLPLVTKWYPSFVISPTFWVSKDICHSLMVFYLHIK